MSLWSFQGACGLSAQEKTAPQDGLSKLSSDSLVEVDIILGDLVVRTMNVLIINEPGATGVIAPESLERR